MRSEHPELSVRAARDAPRNAHPVHGGAPGGAVGIIDDDADAVFCFLIYFESGYSTMAIEQQYGGIWTRRKLGILRGYLRVYCTALQRQSFRLRYADAFAGTGKHATKTPKDRQGGFSPQTYYDGSVRIALETEPGFHEYHFNDLNPDHANEIERIARELFGEEGQNNKKGCQRFCEEFLRVFG